MRFCGYFGNGAVVQRNSPVCVCGYGRKSRLVKCVLRGGTIHLEQLVETDENGRFEAVFPAVNDTDNAFLLSAESNGEKTEAEIRFGDVYLTMGQSNMTYSLSSVEDCDEWKRRAAAADVSVLDLYDRPMHSGEVFRPVSPLEDFKYEYGWTRGRETCIEKISALSVQTAALLSEKEGIPVGVVHTSSGGLGVEAYLKRESAEADEEFIAFLKRIGRYQPTERYNEAGIRNFTQLSGVWNEKIEPLKNSSFAGIVWYLGESSAFDFEFARFYLRAMKMLIKDLEGYFGKIPFVAVHISSEFYPYGDKYGYLYVNEAITALEEAFKDTVRTVPVYDIEPRWLKADGKAYYHPIHTVNKAPVAGRIARSLCGERSHYPKISAVEYSGSKAVCTISNVGPGLAKGEIFGFTLAGENGKYYSARAKAVSDDKIEVTSPDVTEAKCLTYAFMQYQDFCNARTTDGAPVLPFRSVAESVSKNYFFPPAYTADGALEVYENCFGWQTGICHKVPVWKNGEIYRSKKTEISRISTDDGIVLVFRAEPRAEDFFLFGVSPAICLSGHKNHLADFKYLNFEMKSDVESEFLGLILRSVNGENFRADLMNGDGKEFSCFSVCLETGVRGDFAPINFSPDDRKRFVCAEFLFRSRKSVTVFLKGVELSDLNCSVESVVLNNECEKSGATQLPEASDRIAR